MRLLGRLVLALSALFLLPPTAFGQAQKPPIKVGLILPYTGVFTVVYVMKVERVGSRLVNTIVERIPNTSQEETWKWWNK